MTIDFNQLVGKQVVARVWSKYQMDLFDFVSNGRGNAIVKAVAGSGKSTTIVEALKRCSGSTIFLAFGRANAKDLRDKGVNARTFHSLCMRPVLNWLKIDDITEDKLMKLCRQNLSQDSQRKYGNFIRRLVSLAKNCGVGCLIEDTYEAWFNIVVHHDLEIEAEGATTAQGIELARDLLKWSNESNMIDYDDVLYMAVKEGVRLPTFSYVFVDEAQDTNAIQRAIIKKIMSPFSRLIAVGDDAQAIYGFRGADSDSMEQLSTEFQCVELPLTVTYRCGRNIVEEARKYVPHIEAAENASEGAVINLGLQWMDVPLEQAFKPLDLILCRTTRPLMSMAYKFVRAKMPVQIMGRDIGDGLIALIEKMDAANLDDLSAKLMEYRTREVDKAMKMDQTIKAELIADKVSSILYIVETLKETDRSVKALIDVINWLFADKENAIILSTIHRSKGLEAVNVFWLNASQCPSQMAKKPWQLQQEYNLMYVAITRAKSVLCYIEEAGGI